MGVWCKTAFGACILTVSRKRIANSEKERIDWIVSRSRKTAKICGVCSSSPAVCVCDELPSIAVRTRVALIIHHRELSRRSNTGLLAVRVLVNSAMRIRGERGAGLDVSDLLQSGYRSFLFFPCGDARELSRSLVEEETTPIQLIVPDGTWRQARKILSRHPELARLPRVRLAAPERATFQLRAQSSPERTATLPAIAGALGIIEGDAVRIALMKIYQTKIERTLAARGILITEKGLRRAATYGG
jgi:DTW domain-containing protein YfiP